MREYDAFRLSTDGICYRDGRGGAERDRRRFYYNGRDYTCIFRGEVVTAPDPSNYLGHDDWKPNQPKEETHGKD